MDLPLNSSHGLYSFAHKTKSRLVQLLKLFIFTLILFFLVGNLALGHTNGGEDDNKSKTEKAKAIATSSSEEVISHKRSNESALHFDGINDYIDATASSATVLPQGNAARSVEFSVKVPVNAYPNITTLGNVVSWGAKGTRQRSSFGVRNRRAAFIGEHADFTGNAIIDDGQWHHVAITYNGSVWNVYIDGVLDRGNISNGVLNTITHNLFIGKQPTTGELIKGDVDNVRIWDKELSSTEVANFAGKTIPANTSNLVVYYDFNEGTPNADNTGLTTVTDLTGNYNGTLTNFARNGTASNWVSGIVDSTVDTQAPTFDSAPTASSITTTGFTLGASIDEAGDIYYVVLANNATAPTSAEVIAATGNAGAAVLASGNGNGLTDPFSISEAITGLSAGVDYDVYVVARDDEGTPNVQTAPVKVDVTTTSLPTLSSSTPVDGATNVATTSNIVITFSKDIEFGTGNIELIDLTDASNSITITASAPGAEASISGAVLTINPSVDLDDNSNYAVQIAATAIEDLSGNVFAGIGDNTTLDFTTADETAPVFTSAAGATFQENQSGTVYTSVATDANAVTYGLGTGNDEGLFNIASSTGLLTFKTPPSFASPADANNDNIYIVNITATDASNNTSTHQVSVFVYPISNLSGEDWVQVGTDFVGADDGETLGYAVDMNLDGTIVAIGTPGYDNGTQHGSGKAAVYQKSGNSWQQLGSDLIGEGVQDLFGSTVALSRNGQVLAVSAYNGESAPSGSPTSRTGYTKVYKFQSNQWVQVGSNIFGENTSDASGWAIDISADGNTIGLGERSNADNGTNAGQARVFQLQNNNWVQLGSDLLGEAAADYFGQSISISADGTRMAVGGYLNDGNFNNSGHVRVFALVNSNWQQLGADIDSEFGGDESGYDVDLSADGSTVAIGAPKNNNSNGVDAGQVRVYKYNGTNWVQHGADIDGEGTEDWAGWSVSLSDDGNVVAVGSLQSTGNNSSNDGQIQVYSFQSNAWTQVGTDIHGPFIMKLGWSMALAGDGQRLIAGGIGNGATAGVAQIFEFTGIAPKISSVSLATDNSFVDVTFTEAVYNANGGSGALEAADFDLKLTGGVATTPSVTALTKTDGGGITGGETTVRVLFSVTGVADGTEVLEVDLAASSVFDQAGSVADADQANNTATLSERVAPTLSSSTPVDDASDIATNAGIQITFSENVVFGTGNIQVVDVTDASNSITIDATNPGAQASIANNILTINPAVDLDDNSNYAVQIAAGAIEDLSGNAFVGITDNTSLDFSTADETNPVITSANDASFAENGTGTVYTVTATDTNPLTYSLTASLDHNLFNIDTNTGAITFKAAPDFENAQDAGGNNVYNLEVRANDGTNVGVKTVNITVTDLDEANPTVVTQDITVSLDENGSATITTDQIDNGSSDDSAGQLSFNLDKTTFDCNDIGVQTVTLTVTDASGKQSTGTAQVTVNNNVVVNAFDQSDYVLNGVAAYNSGQDYYQLTNLTPTFTSGSIWFQNQLDLSKDFSLDFDIYLGTRNEASPVGSDSGADGMAFVLQPLSTGEGGAGGGMGYQDINPSLAIEFDTHNNTSDGIGDRVEDHAALNKNGDVLSNNANNLVPAVALPELEDGAFHDVNITWNSQMKTLTMSLDGQNYITYTGDIVAEIFSNNAGVYWGWTAATGHFVNEHRVRVENLNFTEDFAIAGSTVTNGTCADNSDGSIALLIAGKGACTSYSWSNGTTTQNISGLAPGDYTVTISNTGSTNVVKTFTVGVTDETASTVNLNGDVTINLNQNEAYNETATAVDNCSGATLAVTGTVDVSTVGTYVLTYKATDASGNESAEVTRTVNVVDNVVPVITSANDASFAENSTGTVYTVTATDLNPVTFSLTESLDHTLFNIDANTGVITFKVAPDSENPQDANNDNVYSVEVRVSDGTNVEVKTINITVTDVDEILPVFTSAGTATFAENGTGTIYTAIATDDNSITYSLAETLDHADFIIDGSTGALSFIPTPDFENPLDGNGDNVYNLEILATDALNNQSTLALAVTITDVDEESPVFTSTGTATFAENGTGTIYTAIATDDNSITYSLAETLDHADFIIDGNTGALSFIPTPDFENPLDGNGDNVYNLEILATDALNNQSTLALGVTVTDVDEDAPVFTSAATASFAENGTGTIYTAVATDAAAITYSLSETLDHADFIIDGSTGALSFIPTPDFENPLDGNGDNVYNLEILATDALNNQSTLALAVTVTDLDEANPTVVTQDIMISLDENGSATLTPAQIDDGSSDDSAGQLNFSLDKTTFDCNDIGVQTVTLTVTDGSGKQSTGTAQVTVNNDVAVNTFVQNDYVLNGVAAYNSGEDYYQLTNLTPTFTSGSIWFQNQLNLMNDFSFDFEIYLGTRSETNPIGTDSGADGMAFVLQPLSTGEGGAGGGMGYQDIFPSLAIEFDTHNNTSDGVGDRVEDHAALNKNGDILSNNANNLVAPVALPQLEDGQFHDVNISWNSQTNTLTMSLDGVNYITYTGDVVADIFSNNAGVYWGWTAATGLFVNEHRVRVENLSFTEDYSISTSTVSNATCAENIDGSIVLQVGGTGACTTYSWSNGATTKDISGLAPGDYTVTVSTTGQSNLQRTFTVGVTDETAPTVNLNGDATINISQNDVYTETATADDNCSNAILAITGTVDVATVGIYTLTYKATDASGNESAEITRTVNVLDNAVPIITSASTVNVAENTTGVVYTVTSDDNTATYSLGSGNDESSFTISGSEVSFVAAPDFETKSSFTINVVATDASGNASDQDVTITVTDVDEEAPVFTSAGTATFAENGTGTIYTAVATDAAAITYSLSETLDHADFIIDGSTGALSFIPTPDFENPLDGNGDNVYNLEILATDALNNQSTLVFAVTITDVDEEAPVFTSAATASFAENGTGTIYTAIATDAAAITYSLSETLDHADFIIVGSTGALSFIPTPDFENPLDGNGDNVYNLEILATDALNNQSTLALAVTVTDVDEEAPVFTSAGTATFAENGTGTIYTAIATDAAAITYSLSETLDHVDFIIDGSTGALSFIPTPDFENPLDGNGDNVYNLEILATDALNNQSTLALAVTVTDVDEEAPVFTSAGAATFAENGTGTIYTAIATDDNSITYGLSETLDHADFIIDGSTGALSFIPTPDFENPLDGNGDNVYNLEILATDALNNQSTLVFAVTITDVDEEAPVFTSAATASFAENGTGTIYTAVATDDNSITYSLSETLDHADFIIDGSTGALSFIPTPDFENPLDGNGDNVYNLEILAIDALNNQSTLALAVTVTDVDEEAPVFTSVGTASFAENGTGTIYTAVATDDNSITYSLSETLDHADFIIDGSTGALSFIPTPDFENPLDGNGDNVYNLEILATDALNNQSTLALAVTVTDLDEANPTVVTQDITVSLDENGSATITAAQIDNGSSDDSAGQLSLSLDKTTFDCNDIGVQTVTLTVTDAIGKQSAGTAQVTVNNNVVVNVFDQSDYVLNGVAAYNKGEDYYQLTNLTPTFTSGSIWFQNQLDLSKDFILDFDIYLGTRNETSPVGIDSGADGMAFVLQPLSTGEGGDGGGMGYQDITPSLAIEFDTHNNTSDGIGDRVEDHAALNKNGDILSNNANNLVPAVALPQLEDGTFHDVVIAWNSQTQTLTMSLDGQNYITYTGDIVAEIFSNNAGVYWGWTAATGHFVNEHRVRVENLDFTEDFAIAGSTVVNATCAENSDGSIALQVGGKGACTSYSWSNGATTQDISGLAPGDYTVTISNPGTTDVVKTFTVGVTDEIAPTVNLNGDAVINLNQNEAYNETATAADNCSEATLAVTGTVDITTVGTYVLTYKATDASGNESAEVTRTVHVLDVTGPVFTSASTVDFAENGTGTVITAQATDLSAITYSLGTSVDEANFNIAANTGAITFKAAPDFEAPTDGDSNNTYIIIVKATDASNNESTQEVTVTVTDVIENVAPVFSSTPVTTTEAGGTYNYEVTTTDADGDNAAITAPTKPDWLSVAAAGRVVSSFTTVPANPTYIEYDASTGDFYVSDVGAQKVIKVSAAGVVTDVAGNGVSGYQDGAATIAQFSGLRGLARADNGDIYVIDGNRIRKISTDGQVSTFAGSGYGFADGSGTAAAFRIPTDIVIDSQGNLFVSDRNNNRIRKITPAGQVSTFMGNGDFGVVDGDIAAGRIGSPKGLALDANDNLYVSNERHIRKITPEGVMSTVGGDGNIVNIDNATGIDLGPDGNLYLADERASAVRKVDLSTGLVTRIAGAGQNSFRDGEALNALFHFPKDLVVLANGDIYVGDDRNGNIRKITTVSYTLSGTAPATPGTHDVILRADDGKGGVAEQSFTITISDTQAPVFTSSTAVDYAENGTGAAYTIIATDDSEITYSLGTGNDEALFTITDAVVSFISSPDFENPSDGDANNSYIVNVIATDANNNGSNQNVIITITDVDEAAPVITSIIAVDFAENGTGVAYTITSDDANANYSLGTGNDEALFTLTGADLSFKTAPDFETQNSYVVNVIATDANNNASDQDVTITITDVDEVAPVISSASAVTFVENGTGVAYTITSDDANAVYSLGTGNDKSSFTISGAEVSFVATPDFETQSSYIINVMAADALGNVSEQEVTIIITDVDEVAPVISSVSAVAFAENGTGVAYTITSDDANAVYSLGTGNDESSFTISGAAVSFVVAPDFETRSSYTINVMATDAVGNVSNLEVTITITDVNENIAPVITSGPVTTVEAGGSYGYNVITTDSDEDVVVVTAPTKPDWLTLNQNLEALVTTFAGSSRGLKDGISGSARFNTPAGIAVDRLGNVFVADLSNHLIRKITPTGEVTTFAGSGASGKANGNSTSASFNQPFGLAIDGSGNLYVGDTGNRLIRKITPTGEVTTLAGSGEFSNVNGVGTLASFGTPYGVAVDKSGNVYVVDRAFHTIRKITPTGEVTTLAGAGNPGNENGMGTSASFNSPSGVAVDESGNVYVADERNHLIRKITPSGQVSTLAGTGKSGSISITGTSATFSSPYGVAVDLSGNVFVADAGNFSIRKISPAGEVSNVAGSGDVGNANGNASIAGFYFPFGVALDGAGNAYVADTYNHLIRRISATSGVTLTGTAPLTSGDYPVVLIADDGNGGKAEQRFTIKVEDNLAPVVTLVSGSSGTVITPSVNVKVQISETVIESLVSTDFIVSNATIENFTKGTDGGYKFTLVAVQDGDATVQLPAGLLTDASGNKSEDSNLLKFTFEAINSAPTGLNIKFSSTPIVENNTEEIEVGKLSAIDPDSNDSHTFTLVDGSGSEDNDGFEIRRDRLIKKKGVAFDYDVQKTASIRVQIFDRKGLSISRSLSIPIKERDEDFAFFKITIEEPEGRSEESVNKEANSGLTDKIADFVRVNGLGLSYRYTNRRGSLIFKQQEIGEAVSRKIRIKNMMPYEGIISSIDLPKGFSISQEIETIPANGEIVLELNFNITVTSPNKRGESGLFTLNSGKARQSIYVYGQAKLPNFPPFVVTRLNNVNKWRTQSKTTPGFFTIRVSDRERDDFDVIVVDQPKTGKVSFDSTNPSYRNYNNRRGSFISEATNTNLNEDSFRFKLVEKESGKESEIYEYKFSYKLRDTPPRMVSLEIKDGKFEATFTDALKNDFYRVNLHKVTRTREVRSYYYAPSRSIYSFLDGGRFGIEDLNVQGDEIAVNFEPGEGTIEELFDSNRKLSVRVQVTTKGYNFRRRSYSWESSRIYRFTLDDDGNIRTVETEDDSIDITVVGSQSTVEENEVGELRFQALDFSEEDISEAIISVEEGPFHGTITEPELVSNADGVAEWVVNYSSDTEVGLQDSVLFLVRFPSDQLEFGAYGSIEVIDVPDDPVVGEIEDKETDEDETLGIPFSASDVDSNLTYSVSSSEDEVSVQLVDGEIKITPEENYNGEAFIELSVTEADGEPPITVTEGFTVSINAVNDSPVIQAIENQVVDEDHPLEFTLSVSDVEESQEVLALNIGSNADENVDYFLSDSGITIVPSNDFNGEVEFYVAADDLTGTTTALSDTVRFTLTVNPVNDAPEAIGSIPVQTLVEGFADYSLDLSNFFTDIDSNGDELVYFLEDITNVNTSIEGNMLTIGSLTGSAGIQTADLVVSDGEFTATQQITFITSEASSEVTIVNALNDLSVLEDFAEQRIQLNEVFAYSSDANAEFTYSLAGVQNLTAFVDGTELVIRSAENFNGLESVFVTGTVDGKANITGFDITVASVNDTPELVTAIDDQTVLEDAGFDLVVATSRFTDIDGDALTLSASYDADWLAFDANTNTFTGTPANGDVGEVTVTVTATDPSGATAMDEFTIAVSNTNDAPDDIALSATALDENVDPGTSVATLSSTDQDEGDDSFTYTLVSGEGDTDNNAFSIIDGQLVTNADFDFEAKSSYSIRVRTTDGFEGTYEEVFTITVNNLNEGITALSIDSDNVNENVETGTVVGAFNSTDLDGTDTFSYELVSGEGDTDNGLFLIEGNELKTNWSLNFESDPTYQVRVKTTDSGGFSFEQSFTVNINDVNDSPTDLALSSAQLAENEVAGAEVGVLSTTDEDAADTFTYELIAGEGDTDNGLFEVDGDRLIAKGSFNYEVMSDYTVRLRTTDSEGLTTEAQFLLGITDANDSPTAIGTIGETIIIENSESGTTITGFTTTDEDANDSHNYSLASGNGDTDNDAFSIVDGQLVTNSDFDFETKTSYSIRVRTDDGSEGTFEEVFTLSVSDVNEVATDLTLNVLTFDEDAAVGTAITGLATTDPDANDTHTYSLVVGEGDTDNESFTILDNGLNLVNAFDFETKSSYSIRLRTTDANGLFYEEAFTIAVNDVNEAATALTLSTTSVEENTAEGTLIAGFATVDQDEGDLHSYALVSGEGDTDNASFTLAGDQLKLQFLPDFEQQSSYSLRVRTTDSEGLFFESAFTIAINDVNEAPTALSLDNANIDENSAIGTAVGSLTTTDEDNTDTHAYSLVAGTGDADNAVFDIVDGVLVTNSDLDFETRDNYSLRVKTVDIEGLEFEQAFEITINNVPEAILRLSDNITVLTTSRGETSQFVLQIFNDGDAALEVLNISYPDGYSGPADDISIAPDESALLAVTFSPTELKIYTGTIEFQTNAGTGSVEVSGQGAIVSSIDDGLIRGESIKVYPNPANNVLMLDLSELGQATALDIEIMGTNGVAIFRAESFRELILKLDVSDYQSGMYLIQFTNGKSAVTKKVIIKH